MLALTRDRRVFSWGYGAEGQCGHGSALHLRTPRPIEALRYANCSEEGEVSKLLRWWCEVEVDDDNDDDC
jgi:hypothetical protein